MKLKKIILTLVLLSFIIIASIISLKGDKQNKEVKSMIDAIFSNKMEVFDNHGKNITTNFIDNYSKAYLNKNYELIAMDIESERLNIYSFDNRGIE